MGRNGVSVQLLTKSCAVAVRLPGLSKGFACYLGTCAGKCGRADKFSEGKGFLATSGRSRARGETFQSGEGIRLFIEAPKGIAAEGEGLSDVEQVVGAKAAGGGVSEDEFFILPVHGGFHRGAEAEKGLLAAVVAEGGLGDGGGFAGDAVLALLG